MLPAVSVYDGKKASKRKAADETLEIKSNPTKRAKTSNVTPVCTLQGFPWDSVNYSCAYDSLLTILCSVYQECTLSWKNQVSNSNAKLSMVGQMFDLIAQKSQTAVEARNQVREAMGLLEPSLGARGSEYTDCYLLANTLDSSLNTSAPSVIMCLPR